MHRKEAAKKEQTAVVVVLDLNMLTSRIITRLAGAPFQVKLVVYLYTGNYIFPSDIFTSVNDSLLISVFLHFFFFDSTTSLLRCYGAGV